jgi:AAA domain/Nuclease-related domain/UvrD-like helicase C-terminal domain
MSGVTMWPTRLPEQVRADRYRRAEVRVYDRLKECLASPWVAFYSRPWLGIMPDGSERDGECDFVIAHPDRGFLAIEVKGGGISFDPAADSWLSTDRDGIRHRIANPVEQARRAKHELLRKLKEQRNWNSRRFIRVRHGVIFPDAASPPGGLGADRPRDLFCCSGDMAEIASWVERRLSGGDDEEGLGADGIRALEKLLAAPFTLRVPLGSLVEEDEQAIAALTPQQFHVLDALQDLPRIAVGGAAGTGKTIVAVEDAVRSAAVGMRTVLLCVADHLADHLRSRLSGSDVTVMTFHEFCAAEASDAGLQVPSSDTDYLDTGCVEVLLKAAESRPEMRFDAVIVDEAQDFRSHWWIALDAIVRDGGRLHVFFDSNQNIYGPVGDQLKALSVLPIRLSRNLRNTKAIHAVASEHYNGPSVTADGPDGVSVERLLTKEEQIARTAAEAARRLILREAVKSLDIAILAPDAALSHSILQELDRSGTHVSAVDTILGFKGLERPVVIVAASRAIADNAELAYVALSRARAHLIIVGHSDIVAWLLSPSRAPAA